MGGTSIVSLTALGWKKNVRQKMQWRRINFQRREPSIRLENGLNRICPKTQITGKPIEKEFLNQLIEIDGKLGPEYALEHHLPTYHETILPIDWRKL